MIVAWLYISTLLTLKLILLAFSSFITHSSWKVGEVVVAIIGLLLTIIVLVDLTMYVCMIYNLIA